MADKNSKSKSIAEGIFGFIIIVVVIGLIIWAATALFGGDSDDTDTKKDAETSQKTLKDLNFEVARMSSEDVDGNPEQGLKLVNKNDIEIWNCYVTVNTVKDDKGVQHGFAAEAGMIQPGALNFLAYDRFNEIGNASNTLTADDKIDSIKVQSCVESPDQTDDNSTTQWQGKLSE